MNHQVRRMLLESEATFLLERRNESTIQRAWDVGSEEDLTLGQMALLVVPQLLQEVRKLRELTRITLGGLLESVGAAAKVDKDGATCAAKEEHEFDCRCDLCIPTKPHPIKPNCLCSNCRAVHSWDCPCEACIKQASLLNLETCGCDACVARRNHVAGCTCDACTQKYEFEDRF